MAPDYSTTFRTNIIQLQHTKKEESISKEKVDKVKQLKRVDERARAVGLGEV